MSTRALIRAVQVCVGFLYSFRIGLVPLSWRAWHGRLVNRCSFDLVQRAGFSRKLFSNYHSYLSAVPDFVVPDTNLDR